MTNVTKTEVASYVRALAAMAEAIRELGSVPSGQLYARVLGAGISLETYQAMLASLVGAGLVSVEPSHLVRWIGPQL